jgi:glucose/arabinose dehydrogenase
MPRTASHGVALALITAVLVAGAFWGWQFLRPLIPAFGPAAPLPSVSPESSDAPVPLSPLSAAEGWTVSLLTDGVPGARDLAVDPFGNVWVSQPSQGTVSLVYLKGLVVPEVSTVLRGLKKPHGLAFDPEHPTALYVATETEVFWIPTYSEAVLQHVADLPAGGRHFTRSLAFGPDNRLYVSIGSTCDTCYEKNPEHGSIISMKPDGSDRKTVATGLRNSVFMARQPSSGTLWATDMGRDHLGDSLPPDEVNVILAGKNYGWPLCFGDKVHDTDFDKNQYVRDPCADTTSPIIELGAHVAPLGLAFLDDNTLLVAEHGSWNSSVPVGYRVKRWRFSFGSWKSDDFLTGFLKGGQAIGRPVDVLPMPDGSLLISDDKAGAIWRMTPTP